MQFKWQNTVIAHSGRMYVTSLWIRGLKKNGPVIIMWILLVGHVEGCYVKNNPCIEDDEKWSI